MDVTKLSKDSNKVHQRTERRFLKTENIEAAAQKGSSRLVSKILSPAVQLWLRSQLQNVEYLQVKIEGSDRQLLTGSIPRVSLIARAAIYEGLHLTEVKATATDININLGQVLRGESLRILAPFQINCELQLAEAHLNASFDSPLLEVAVIDFLTQLLPLEEPNVQLALPINLNEPRIVINSGSLTLLATLSSPNCSPISLLMRTGIQLTSPRELLFQILEWKLSSLEKSLPAKTIEMDLGSEVEIEQLTLTPGKIFAKGKLTVRP
ncbi:MAG: DUF2993 domain-containing protein [Cyanobacteriota bacterium]|nr:DUF2993 domain-containing protein [Cyanobacteriota bacterium]